jgi:hypothetical protein
MIEKARKLGIKVVCVHKGIPFGRRSYEHSLCDDVGVVAARFPDVKFLIYHSGFVPGQPEGPRDPARNEGVDSLVNSLAKSGVKPGSNVYAELGSTWRFVMRDRRAPRTRSASWSPRSARTTCCGHRQHLVRLAAGPDRRVSGVPDFSGAAREDGYAELHAGAQAQGVRPQCRQGVFARRRCVEKVSGGRFDRPARASYAGAEDPTFATYGPKTRAEFVQLGGG